VHVNFYIILYILIDILSQEILGLMMNVILQHLQKLKDPMILGGGIYSEEKLVQEEILLNSHP
jgi:hypothetical protein